MDARSALADEQRRLLRQGHERTLLCPALDRLTRLAADRHMALLAALAEDLDFPLGHVMQAGQIESSQLGQAQTGRIEQLEHSLIAQFQAIPPRMIQQAIGLVGGKYFR